MAMVEATFDLNGHQFGGENDPVVVTAFDPGQSGVRDQDIDFRDGILMGRDYLTPPAWTFEMTTNREGAADALDALAALSGVWRADWNRERSDSMAVLRYRLGGRTRRVYGRPRRWRSAVTDALWDGMASAVADFQLADARYYADVMWSEEIGFDIGEGEAGGLVTPLTTPLTTVGGVRRDGLINYNDGTAPSPPIITFKGPVTNPRLEGPGWVVELDTNIPARSSVIVDCRPWVLQATRNNGTPLGHTLSRWTRLSNVLIPVGTSELKYSGIDSTKTSTVEVAWRAAYASL